MKNKSFLLLLALPLVLAGCPNSGNSTNPDNNPKDPSQEGEPSGDPSEDPSGDPSHGDGGGQSEGDVKTDTLKSKAELRDAIGHSFLFKFGTMIYGRAAEVSEYATDGIYSVVNEFNYPYLYKYVDGYLHQYNNMKNDKYYGMGSLRYNPDDNTGPAESKVEALMAQFTGSIQYTEKKSTTLLGRAATEYILDQTESGGTLHMETIIDNQTGLALRHYSFFAGTTLKQLPTSFETVEFNIRNEKVTEYLSTHVAKIAFSDWDTDFMNDLGAGSPARPNGVFFSGELKERDDETEYDLIYYLTTGTVAELVAKAKTVIKDLYDAGFKYDYDGKAADSFEDLIDFDEEYNRIDAYGFVSSDTDGHYVDVSGYPTTMSSVFEGSVYRLDFSFHKIG